MGISYERGIMLSFGKKKKETLRNFDYCDLDEVMGMIALGTARASGDTEEILAGLEAGRFTRDMAVRMFRKPFPIFLRP
jgi:hypothetical protein